MNFVERDVCGGGEGNDGLSHFTQRTKHRDF